MIYRHLFFDLDHTLWDHKSNADETLKDLYQEYTMYRWGNFNVQEFIATFHQINHQLWEYYHLGKVDQHYLRKERFPLILKSLGVEKGAHYSTLAEDYLRWCPQKSNLMPGTKETLDYLKTKYSMSVITNGFFDVQATKLSCSGLNHYFDCVITSQEAGKLKPDPGIFQYAVDQVETKSQHCVMIGDNPATDIAGAKSAGIDQIYYDPYDSNVTVEATYKIQHLEQLCQLL